MRRALAGRGWWWWWWAAFLSVLLFTAVAAVLMAVVVVLVVVVRGSSIHTPPIVGHAALLPLPVLLPLPLSPLVAAGQQREWWQCRG